MEHEGIKGKLSGAKQSAIPIHPSGHGSMEDLATLQCDLLEEGFQVRVYGELDRLRPYEPPQ
jgi:hypothetical protein